MAGEPGGRRAVVTGAGRGLGLEWVRQLAAGGWTVLACARRPLAAPGLGALVESAPDRVVTATLDVTARGEAARIAEALAVDWPSVDLLVNNAGVDRGSTSSDGAVGPLAAIDHAELLEVLEVNAVGPVVVTQAFAPLLAKAGRAVVVNTSSRLGSLSIAASGADPYARSYGYRMSKAALNMATVQLAGDLAAQGTVVVAMSPGYVRTDMTSANADLDVDESVAGQLATTLGLDLADSGSYLAHTGERLPW